VPTSQNWAQSASRVATGAVLASFVVALSGCNPTVKVEAPDKPIVINLNVKIEQEVRVKVDKDVESLVNNNPNLF
jgi:hypothetical protein